jgi:hypothetical protein
LEPSLAQENLEGYFYIARDRLSFSNTHTQRLSQLLQELLSKLRAESDTERQQGIKEARLLSSSELHTVYSILLAHFQRDPQAFTGKRIHVLLQLAVHQPDLVPMLAHTLRSSTPSSIQSALPIAIKTTFSAHGPLPQELVDVLQHWSIQQTNSPLTKAAKLALKDTH